MITLRKFWYIFIFLAAVTMLALALKNQTTTSTKLQDHQKINIQIANQTLNVEVVNTPESMSKGLGDRTEIGSDGMLFILPNRQKAPFWMKDMQMDLDFVWIVDGRVVQINEDIKAPKTTIENEDQNLPVIVPNQAVDLVLELPAGSIQAQHLQVGDIVHLNQ